MRIVHVVPTEFGPGGLFGGGERYPVELARAQARHADVQLVTYGDAATARSEACGLRVYTLRRLLLLRGHPAQPVAFGLSSLLRGADVVHTHHTRSAPSRLSAVLARVAGKWLATTDHGLGGGGWGGLLPALFDRFLTVSRFAADVLGVPPARTRVVYGGADPERFQPDPDLRRDGVLYVGRVTPHKGIDRLITALPTGARLTVVGSAAPDLGKPERDYPRLLRRLAAGRDVVFAGPVREEMLPRLLRQAQVVVLPSVEVTCYGRTVAISELLGLSVLEAMASGTPVVASRLGGLPEIVRDGETGFLVAPGDVPALNDRVGRLLADRDLGARIGRAARDSVLDAFTWDHCARRCLDAYQERDT
jgi:glycosyltransferase involved in cell wall biosynthesis